MALALAVALAASISPTSNEVKDVVFTLIRGGDDLKVFEERNKCLHGRRLIHNARDQAACSRLFQRVHVHVGRQYVHGLRRLARPVLRLPPPQLARGLEPSVTRGHIHVAQDMVVAGLAEQRSR